MLHVVEVDFLLVSDFLPCGSVPVIRHCIQVNRAVHLRRTCILKLLLELGLLATMMRLKFHCLPFGLHCTTCYSLFSMLTFRQKLKHQNRQVFRP